MPFASHHVWGRAPCFEEEQLLLPLGSGDGLTRSPHLLPTWPHLPWPPTSGCAPSFLCSRTLHGSTPLSAPRGPEAQKSVCPSLHHIFPCSSSTRCSYRSACFLNGLRASGLAVPYAWKSLPRDVCRVCTLTPWAFALDAPSSLLKWPSSPLLTLPPHPVTFLCFSPQLLVQNSPLFIVCPRPCSLPLPAHSFGMQPLCRQPFGFAQQFPGEERRQERMKD